MDFKEYVIDKLTQITELERSVISASVEVPPEEKLGDLAFPCFPLAKVMRTRLKKEGIKKLKVVYSKVCTS